MQNHQLGDAAMHAFQSVFFEPWIGSQYETTGLWGRKVLIVGESHYDEFHENKSNAVAGNPPPKHVLDRGITKDCISDVVRGTGGATFWTKVRNRIGGNEYEIATPEKFWHKVAFYNFVQMPVSGGPGARPTKKQFEDSVPAFKEVLEFSRPDRIIVISDKTSGYIPDRTGNVGTITDGEGTRSVDYFTLQNEKKSYIVMLSHPRSSYLPRALSPEIHRFIIAEWTA